MQNDGSGEEYGRKALADMGEACADYHDKHVRNLEYAGCNAMKFGVLSAAKKKNATAEQKSQGWGDVWTWIGIDADTKLVVGYLVGGRDAGWAREFMEDCASRIRGRVQLTTDAHSPT